MPKRTITAGAPMGHYSPAVVVNGFCFVSGQGGIDPATRTKVEGGIQAETEQTLKNIAHILGAASYSLQDVVKVTCYLADISDWAQMNEVWARYFPTEPPARATVGAKELPGGTRIEIDCVAWKD